MPGLLELVALTRMELLRIFRTEQVYLYLLLPALLILPVTMFGAVMAQSASGAVGTVAIPPDLPEELDLARHLEQADLEVVVRADPRAAWEARKVDAAIVGWRAGAGIGGADKLEVAERERWRLTMVVDDAEVGEKVREAAEQAGEALVDDWVALAGGSPGRDVDVATVVMLEHPDDDYALPFDGVRASLAYVVFMLSLIAFFFLTLPSVVDRREGVTETLRALPISPTALVWARILALVGVQVLTAALIALNLVLLLTQIAAELGVGWPWEYVPGVLAAVMAVDAMYAALGVIAPSARLANNLSSIVMTVSTALLFWAATGAPPVWVPIAGVIVADTPLDHVIAVASSLLLAMVVVAITGRLLATRVTLVLARGEA